MNLSELTIHQIQDDSDPHLMKILKLGLDVPTQDSYYLENYHPLQASNPRNIFNLLSKGKFLEGAYYIVTHEDKYLASAGWYPFEDVIIGLSRANIINAYKSLPLLGDLILPKILSVSDKTGKKVWMTFNENNKTIYEGFKRVELKKAPTFGAIWPTSFRKFKPIGQNKINNFLQYVVEYDPNSFKNYR